MVNESEIEKKNESFEQLRTQVMAGLEIDEDEPPVDFILEDITTDEIDQYLKVIKRDQDVPEKLFKLGSYRIRDEGIFAMLCDYSCVNPIPKEIAKNQININICLLQNSPQFIKDMHMKLGKLKIQDINFVKFENYK